MNDQDIVNILNNIRKELIKYEFNTNVFDLSYNIDNVTELIHINTLIDNLITTVENRL